MLDENKAEIIAKVANMFSKKSDEEKAFVLGYMIAVEQLKSRYETAKAEYHRNIVQEVSIK